MTSFVRNTNATTKEDVEVMVYLLLGVWHVVFCADISLNGCTNGFKNSGLDFCEGDTVMTH